MIFNEIFDHIYVLNLKESTDRKNHIETEFKRVGIEKYNFFEATPYYSDEVKNLMESELVKKFPNCFRCNKKRCDCENNYLTPFQIANWCSFINIFKDIINNDYKFVLICEDDIVFTFQYKRIINTLLNPNTFKHYKIDFNKPLLLRLGTAFNPYNHNSNNYPRFIKNFSLCNPCFAINKSMAIIYLHYLKIIDYHSDIYFHKKIPKNVKGIQYFTMYPYPVYELSFVKEKQKFESLIRPNNEFRRLEYKEFLFLTTNSLLEIFIKTFTSKINLLIDIEKINFNGNINNFIIYNEKEKKRYYFENKILLIDDYYDNIKIIYNNIKSNNNYIEKYNIYINKINEIYDENIEYIQNDENLLKNIIIFYENLLKIFDFYTKKDIIKININNINNTKDNSFIFSDNNNKEKINKIINMLNSNIFKKELINYFKYKNILLDKIELTNNDIDKFKI
jgi:GR25 family glycosyltransferase involved in LPS biosynthesis